MNRQAHWQAVYLEKEADAVSWYREHLEVSLDMLRGLGLPAEARILDAGAGASTFVDDVLELGFSQITAVDISAAALDKSRNRLLGRAEEVTWFAADITSAELPAQSVDFWHDRAVFHFLTEHFERRAYVNQLQRCIAPKGHVLLATFHIDGPAKCSGLNVQRYSADMMSAELGNDFRLLQTRQETHVTPWKSEQQFIYALFQRSDGSA